MGRSERSDMKLAGKRWAIMLTSVTAWSWSGDEVASLFMLWPIEPTKFIKSIYLPTYPPTYLPRQIDVYM